MLKFIQNNREITALLAVVLLFVLPGFLDRQYLSVQTLTMVYSSAQILILLAMGATLVMLTRNIDVSVGSITGMCAVLLGMLLNAGYSLPVACVATLLLGLLAGFFNGVLVAWLKIPAIVATLGTLGLYRGIMLLWTGGKWIEGLPAELKQLSAPLLFGVSAIGWLTIILVAFMAWLLAKTAFGRSFYVTGDNLQGARQLGVRTEAIRIVAFSLNGCMAALAGIVFASQIGFIPNQTGTGLEMKAIAACVLGGISIEIVAFGAINPRMLDLNMLLFSTSDFICIGIVALPLTMVIVSGGIDISFGSTIGLCAIALGVLFQSGVPMPLAILLTLLLGALCGLINAGLIIYTKVNPLVITLGTLYLFAGSALLLSGMAGATGYEGIGGFPMAFTDFANLDVLGLPVPLIIFLICLLVFWLWLHKTHAGRNVFLIGQSPRVAVYSAIPVNRTLCALYAMTGLASAVAAVLLVSYFGSARSDLGASFLMPAITAVVLGGANIYGGSGSIIGTAIAVLLVGYLQQGLQMAGVPNQVSSALSGALLIVVVVGRSVSLHRQQIKEWLARRANNPLP
ncbi:TPA: autoinducer 2 ABC transporter permease LsrD [Escherichia coli]|nr:autoinducer 2 ABC transporter permease LsrD [Escherichia coli]HCO5501200.1 autoinducer 2 ABC transporter permease LsrD [Escherichia coli]